MIPTPPTFRIYPRSTRPLWLYLVLQGGKIQLITAARRLPIVDYDLIDFGYELIDSLRIPGLCRRMLPDGSLEYYRSSAAADRSLNPRWRLNGLRSRQPIHTSLREHAIGCDRASLLIRYLPRSRFCSGTSSEANG